VTRRRRLRGAVITGLSLVLVAGGIYTAAILLQRSERLITEECTAAVGSQRADLATDQAANAALITAVSVRRGLPPRAASIALATAMQESKLRNIGHGDLAGPDSRGLFQQRPSQGWGTQEQVMDPIYASNAFYDALVKVPGYATLEITDAAQRVQRSAYPAAYAQHEAMGRSFASALTGETLEVDVSDSYAWSVAHWAVANAKQLSVERVDVNGKRWDRKDRNGWQDAPDAGGGVTITLAGAGS
jgi:hypothetical protein